MLKQAVWRGVMLKRYEKQVLLPRCFAMTGPRMLIACNYCLRTLRSNSLQSNDFFSRVCRVLYFIFNFFIRIFIYLIFRNIYIIIIFRKMFQFFYIYLLHCYYLFWSLL
jgi:hypothetical protein